MKDMIKLNYSSGPKVLHLIQNDVVFWLDGMEKTFKSLLYSEVLIILASRHPKTVPTNEIFELLQSRHAVGSRFNPEQTVHKYVHGARQDLIDAGLRMDVIKNVRGLGYRLGDGWSVESSHKAENLVDREIEDLRKLVERCIHHLHSKSVTINHGGLMYFEADPLIIKENMILLNRIGWQLIHNLSAPENIPDVLDIKSDISELLSYVIFWRIGHRLTEEEWKLDYVCEVNKTLDDIELRILKIKRVQALKLKESRLDPLQY
jgi:hypothetical protein